MRQRGAPGKLKGDLPLGPFAGWADDAAGRGGAMREPGIGIDLGTTYSAVAVTEEGRPRIIPNRAGLRLTPSMIAFTRTGERVVGEAARLLLEEIPENVAYATKRFIGRRWSEPLAEEARSVVPYP